MRILVLCRSSVTAIQASQFKSSQVVRTMHPPPMLLLGDSEVRFFPLTQEYEIQQLRGQRFDLVLENSCFNPERSALKDRLFHLACITVLR